MKKTYFLIALFVLVANAAMAQTDGTTPYDDGTFTADGYRNIVTWDVRILYKVSTRRYHVA